MGTRSVPQVWELRVVSRVLRIGMRPREAHRAFGVVVGLQAACHWEWKESKATMELLSSGTGRLSPVGGVSVTSAALLDSLFSAAGPCF